MPGGEARGSSATRILELPSGELIKYKMPRDLGGPEKWWRTKFPDVIQQSVKSSLPNATLWTSPPDLGEYSSIVCADFDTLPAAYPNWDEFRDALEDATPFPVAVTPSGKAKVFILTKGIEPMSLGVARAVILKWFGQWVEGLDLSPTAMSSCYVTESVFHSLSLACSGSYLDLGREQEYTIYSTPSNQQVREVPTVLKEWARDKPRSAFAEGVLTLPLATPFNLSVNRLEALCGINRGYMGRFIGEWVKNGWLVCLDGNFEYGKKARTYQAVGEAQAWFKRRRFKAVEAPEAGRWYAYLWSEISSWSWKDLEQLEGMGVGKKRQERLNMARRIWKCYHRKRDGWAAAAR